MSVNTHDFVDDGSGKCDYYYKDDIGEGYSRHIQCARSKEQPEHGGPNAQA